MTSTLGRQGGRLQLGTGNQPVLYVPPGTLGDEGRTFAMRLVEDGRPGGAAGTAATPAFEVSPPTEATIDHAFHVSAAIRPLPPGCTEDALRLAVERPNDVGPGDGTGSPTLRWEYDRVSYDDGVAAGSLVRIYGQRMQFVCAASTPVVGAEDGGAQ